jgi:putative spermidine/putrescine transport system ATP-binding protein
VVVLPGVLRAADTRTTQETDTVTQAAAADTPPMDADPVAAVRVRGLTKRFGDVTAVDAVDLDIFDGEFLTLLGPSGSGKTTVLRMIAGFELPSGGSVELSGRDVTRVPPFERDVNTVFQDYALFPHMSVRENVEYGLRVKKVPRAERRERAGQALADVRLEGYGDRKPGQLSGGQRQRVALARALVNRPRVLLLDEPLGALDLKLRQQMQVELKDLQREVGITFVFVTHDQEEALTMSDRIAVFDQGKIEQLGTPGQVYETPSTPFVAGFVGTSNLLSGDAAQAVLGKSGTFSIRPEKIRMVDSDEQIDETHRSAMGRVRDVEYLGSLTRFHVALDAGGSLMALQQNLHLSSTEATDLRGRTVRLVWNVDNEFRVADAT